jgi:dTDP-4-amino-4,6-dideoxygalactose transaminase
VTVGASSAPFGDSGPPVPFVDLSSATEAIRSDLLSELEELLDAGSFVNGPYVERFESRFAGFVGRAHCVGVASGLDALRLGLQAAGCGPGDEILVPALTFIATFEAVAQAGCRCVVVDVREDDAGMDPLAAAAAVTDRTSGLMPVHLYGQMADVRALTELAEGRGLVLLEDACQAHGASRDGIVAGSAGAAAAFSFYPSKNLGAMGDAGALVTDDVAIATAVRALRQHGEASRYRSQYQGYTARLDAIQALVLSHKLPHLPEWNRARADAAARYLETLSGVGDLRLPVVVPGAVHVWHLFTVRTADPAGLAAFLERRGIATGRHYPEPPHLSAAFRDLGSSVGAFPVAEAIAGETLSLPLYPGITEAQIETVVSGVRAYFAGG